MPFIGSQPTRGAYLKCDAITTSATASYTLQVNGGSVSPASANNMLVSLNGVIQAPQDAYTVTGSTITFDSALTSSDVIDFILILGNTDPIGTPADGTITTNKLQNNAITTAKLANSSVTGAKIGSLPAGSVLQVKSGTYDGQMTLTVDTRTDIPNLSLPITPSSTSSKILVSSSICYGCTGTNLYASAFFMRDSTDIGIGTGATGNRLNISFPLDMSGHTNEIYKLRQSSMTFLDSPSTTSTITYKVQARHAVNGTMYINRSGQDSNADYGTRGISTLTIMEIAG